MKLCAENFKKSVTKARNNFYQEGFTLPRKYVEAVEAARIRGHGEQGYEQFIDEVLYESFSLTYPWQPAVRKLLQPSERSGYLDVLMALHDDPAPLSLDPNFAKFARPSNSASWLRILHEFDAYKAADKALFFQQISAVVNDARGSLRKAFGLVGEINGYVIEPSRASTAMSFVSRDADIKAHQISLKIVDPNALKKHGDVLLRYCFPSKPDFAFGIDMCVPGAYLYQRRNDDLHMVVFSFFVQCKFASLLNESLSAVVEQDKESACGTETR